MIASWIETPSDEAILTALDVGQGQCLLLQSEGKAFMVDCGGSDGETAADIQLRADINRYTLQNANPTADLDSLTAGQVLCVPSVNRTCPTSSTYTLQAEDSLESVALRLNTSLSALLRANPCLAPSDFSAGRCINVP